MNILLFIRSFCLICVLGCCMPDAQTQTLSPHQAKFSKADSLRGSLSPLRSCYDILYYHLDITPDIVNKSIQGKNLFKFKATERFHQLQFDLFNNLSVDKIVYKNQLLKFNRAHHAVFVDFPTDIEKGKIDSFEVWFSGKPIVAHMPPWDGGFIFTKDKNGNPWVSTAVQGLGASAWWPNKDHQSDEVDSMLISVTVPAGLVDVSNGKLRSREALADGRTKFNWFVSNPINNYCVSLNIGKYKLIEDTYQGLKGLLPVSYWVLEENYEVAKKYFPVEAPKTLEAFEYWFGPYPFYSDSYKLVDAPYLGMEHQSAVTYGNKYKFGYLGKDMSQSGWGLKWDFIIVHESGHEWFGNNITSKDLADMWIHEAFTDYAEALYVDYFFGKKASEEYVYGKRKGILNDTPIQGPFGVNQEGSRDMYNKGGVMLNMVRAIINNDALWRKILTGLNKKFYHQTVDYNDIVTYINSFSKYDLRPFFHQYIQHKDLPTLIISKKNNNLVARWKADVPNFKMPVAFLNEELKNPLIEIKDSWTRLPFKNTEPNAVKIDSFRFYIKTEYQ